MMRLLVTTIVCWLLATNVVSGIGSDSQAFDRVNLYVTLNPPFVFENAEGELVGYDIELWDIIVQRMQMTRGVEYTVQQVTPLEFDTVVTADPAGLGLGGRPITKVGNDKGEFTYTYFHTGLDVLVLRPDLTTDPLLFFSPFEPMLWITGVIALYFSGHVIWALEHAYQPTEFPLAYLRGVNEGIWYCWGILSETGEKNLLGFPSRLYSIGWTTFTVTLVAAYTAQLTTILTAANIGSDISTLHDLSGTGMAVVVATDAERYIRDHLPSVALFAYSNITSAFNALSQEKVTGLMADASTLEYFFNQASSDKFKLLGSLLTSADYAILLPNASPYLTRLNTIILELTSEGTLAALNLKYFGKPFIDSIGGEEIQSPALTLQAISGVYFAVLVGLAIAIIIYIINRLCFCF